MDKATLQPCRRSRSSHSGRTTRRRLAKACRAYAKAFPDEIEHAIEDSRETDFEALFQGGDPAR
jgi:hypothetical protein